LLLNDGCGDHGLARDGEHSDGDRTATGGSAAAHRDPEVVAQAQRRRFTAEYKQRIVAETDQAKAPAVSALSFARSRARSGRRLRRKIQSLAEELRTAEIVINIQKMALRGNVNA
jgi:hypothetical protein